MSRVRTLLLAGLMSAALPQLPWSAPTQPVVLRAHTQHVYIYGSPSADPVIVSSGDGGWIHLGPQVAEFLGAHGYYVVGFDAKAYLESFTSAKSTLQAEDVSGDYKTLVAFAAKGTGRKPMLIGVSEGAGLSVLAAGDVHLQPAVSGIIALGLPERCELAWRWKDAVIYMTHRAPDEPGFNSADVIGRISPLPIAAIHSTNDEFVPVPAIQQIMSRAREPKQLWIVKASNHRFSDNVAEFNTRLVEAMAWVKGHTPP